MVYSNSYSCTTLFAYLQQLCKFILCRLFLFCKVPRIYSYLICNSRGSECHICTKMNICYKRCIDTCLYKPSLYNCQCFNLFNSLCRKSYNLRSCVCCLYALLNRCLYILCSGICHGLDRYWQSFANLYPFYFCVMELYRHLYYNYLLSAVPVFKPVEYSE